MPSKKPQNKDSNVTVAIIGAIATIMVAFFGLISVWLQLHPSTITTATATMTETAILATATPELRFAETFDKNNNKAGWATGEASDDGSKLVRYIKDEIYYYSIDTYENSDGVWWVDELPDVIEEKFCLIFDARLAETSGDNAIVIVARATNFDDNIQDSYYKIDLYGNGQGKVFLDIAGDNNIRQIAAFDKNIYWNDTAWHKIKVSLQDNDLEIYDGQTNTILYTKSLMGDDLLSGPGKIFLGAEIFAPNNKITLGFDNIYVYNKCP